MFNKEVIKYKNFGFITPTLQVYSLWKYIWIEGLCRPFNLDKYVS